MRKCKFCSSEWKKEISLKNHERQCNDNPDSFWTAERRLKASVLAKECAKVCKPPKYNLDPVCCVKCKRVVGRRQLTNHYNSLQCNVDSGDICLITNKSNPRSKESRVRCPHCKKSIRNKSIHFENCRSNPEWVNKSNIWTDDRRKKHSERMSRAVEENPDSYSKSNICGRVKIIEYKPGVKLKGSWEVRVAEWLDSQNILWESEVNPHRYKWNGVWKLYFPDFYLPELNCYIEVKGYRRERDVAKWNHFDDKLLIIEGKTIGTLREIDINYALSNLVWGGQSD